ncbi:MAG: 1-deoxy-D-xylulose-5-phosphate synthase [Melioribacteraceae bacterium]|jgi:1-deoxy-D-xylulose-5-phosphate synthase|nr:MAG: 1-deoxy-D-xylulose-5-phosphate synthase [Ignavibacteriales bacterium]WKZ70593.1 MAG: 1-deoxy-D-xylulose-5-phosphate synthase [Melioribacteraceae bacterium]
MVDRSQYNYLFNVDSPNDIKNFSVHDLKELCSEIRQYMVDVISQVGGHFGGGLGSVELTVALHKVFNTPNDLIVWDTGHQAYPHKIITGRRDQLHTIRRFHGLSGFLKRTESEYDAFGAGHASTSISAALGMATGSDLLKTNKKVIAIIGDGAMTGGMAYEAMNNSGVLQKNLIVVLNDNNMSIAPNVWQISNYFTEMISHPEYNRFKGAIWDLTGKLDDFGDRLRKVAARLESGIKSVITPGMLFEALGFRYFGPVNGHNVGQLVKLFEHIKDYNGPLLVHAITEKGKGYKPAEGHVQRLHASTPFDKITGKAIKKGEGGAPSYTAIFGNAMVELVKDNPKIVGITAAMPDGTGMDKLQAAYPENYFDVGIAEEHAVTFAAGLATQGVIPVVAIYSSFLQRGFDQIIHDVALQKLKVVFALDRAGLVGADGPTHHGTFDLSYLRMIPGMVIMAPKDEQELRDMLYTSVSEIDGPSAIRYPRGNALGVELREGFEKIVIGKAETLVKGEDVALLSVGNMVEHSLKASEKLKEEGINSEVINMRFIKPLDTKLLDDIASRFDKVVTIEENSIVGGFGSGVVEYFNDKNYKNDIIRIGIPDTFIDHGTQAELHNLIGIDADGIFEKVKVFCKGSGIKHEVVA